MSSLLNDLQQKSTWEAFFQHKNQHCYFSKKEAAEIKAWIDTEAYLPYVQKILFFSQEHAPALEAFFALPVRSEISKTGTNQKRILYTFPEPQNLILKCIAYLLYRYDSIFAPNCYAFRQNISIKDGIRFFTCHKDISRMYCYKTDISGYFDHISIPLLLPMLQEIFCEDLPLYRFFERLLTSDLAKWQGNICSFPSKGIMAGTPVAPFLANVYLNSMDHHFAACNTLLYARYSDDIILFASDKEELEQHVAVLKQFLTKYQLTVNPKKEYTVAPGETWDFLGISFTAQGNIDISDTSFCKLKKKLRRKARSIYRRKLRLHMTDSQALSAYTRSVNQKLLENRQNQEFTWARWYFPLINSDRRLREIDHYIQQNLRYIVTGKHTKKNYQTDYACLKQCGYRSLVHAYYQFRKEGFVNDRS